jgi:enoyl-CoA hydratase
MTSYQHLTVERGGWVSTVSLNRPSVHNALNFELLTELEDCALGFRDDTETRVVIFTGAGKHFCAGAELGELNRSDDETLLARRRRLRLGERVLSAIQAIDQITITAWNGGALGGGACVATATDLRIGASNCFIHYPEIELGFNVMWQSLPRTVRLIGEARAVRLLIGAERVYADTLLAWGLLDEVVAPEKLASRVAERAGLYVAKPPMAAQMIKRSISAAAGALDRAIMHMDADQHLLASLSEDHQCAFAGYQNREIPNFTGR